MGGNTNSNTLNVQTEMANLWIYHLMIFFPIIHIQENKMIVTLMGKE